MPCITTMGTGSLLSAGDGQVVRTEYPENVFPSCIAARYSGVTWKGASMAAIACLRGPHSTILAIRHRQIAPSVPIDTCLAEMEKQKMSAAAWPLQRPAAGIFCQHEWPAETRPERGRTHSPSDRTWANGWRFGRVSLTAESRRSLAPTGLDSPLRLAKKHPICDPHRYGPRSTRRESFNIDPDPLVENRSTSTPIHSSRIVQHRPRSTRRESFNIDSDPLVENRSN
jgi:hypothetical protein